MKQKNTWKLVDRIHTVGPLASRDILIPIDLENHEDERVELKIETGFMFWETDYVGMDFSTQAVLQTHHLSPTSADDGNQVDECIGK